MTQSSYAPLLLGGLVFLFVGAVVAFVVVWLVWRRRKEIESIRLKTRVSPLTGVHPWAATVAAAQQNSLGSAGVDYSGVVEAKRILSRSERAFYFTLRSAVEQDYLIFPQVPVRSVLKRKGKVPSEHYGMLENGIADFVLVHPKFLGPMLVIELDDSSHMQADARQRDARKSDLFKWAGVPLLRVAVGSQWSVGQLRTQIIGLIKQTLQESQVFDDDIG